MASVSTGTVSLRDLMLPFAQAIYEKATVLREREGELTKAQQNRLRESISEDIKKATTLHPHRMSVAAAEQAPSDIDLPSKNWHDQPKFDRGRTRFIAEHMVPVAALARACRVQPDVDGILDVLVHQPRMVWLLRREDNELTRLGFRADRPDPVAAYRAAGITIANDRESNPGAQR